MLVYNIRRFKLLTIKCLHWWSINMGIRFIVEFLSMDYRTFKWMYLTKRNTLKNEYREKEINEYRTHNIILDWTHSLRHISHNSCDMQKKTSFSVGIL